MLRNSPIPQLFILGRHDEYIPEEIAEDALQRNPQARVVWLEESGHMGFMEEPEKSADAILGFLGEVYGGNV